MSRVSLPFALDEGPPEPQAANPNTATPKTIRLAASRTGRGAGVPSSARFRCKMSIIEQMVHLLRARRRLPYDVH
jgi:hypothetical protein